MKKIMLAAMLLFSVYNSKAQCVFPDGISVPEVACDAGSPLTNNANINSNTVYHFNGTNGNFSNISLAGGTLVLCGSATLNNVNHNGGTILIKPGATITFTGNYNIGGSPHLFFNLGHVTFPGNVQLQGNDQFVYNGPGATLVVNGQITFLNSGTLFNYGTTTANKIVVNGSNVKLCFGPGAISITQSIESNGSGNAITVPSGNACVSYTVELTGNAPLTNSSNFKICQAPGASAPMPGTAGNSIVTSGCTSCDVLLPVKLSVFNAEESNGRIHLKWNTEMEENVSLFIVEKSIDGSAFYPVGHVSARNMPSSYEFNSINSGKSYFRLKIVDRDGTATYSRIISVQSVVNPEWRLLTNPVNNAYLEIAIQGSQDQLGRLYVMDIAGRIISYKSIRLLKGNNVISYSLKNISAGNYYLQFRSNKSYLYKPIRFIKN